MSDAQEPRPTIQEQLAALTKSPVLASQTSDLSYGQVVFEVRDGRIYRVHVTSSILIRESEMAPRVERRQIYKTPQESGQR